MTEFLHDQWASHDLYRRLGLSPEATPLEITRAYRRAARNHHPDLNPTGEENEFRSVQEAYDVLGHSDTRARYDLFRAAMAAQATDDIEASDQWINGTRMMIQHNVFQTAFRFNPWLAFNPWAYGSKAS